MCRLILKMISLALALWLYGCNKNSLQLPDRQEDSFVNKDIVVNGSNAIKLTFRQDKNEVEGKTGLIFKNLSGLSITGLKVLIERGRGERSFFYCDSILNQCIISIDTLHASKEYTCPLPFYTTTLDKDHFQVKLISSSGMKQLSSGSYSSVYVAFEKSDKSALSYGTVNGYIAADGEALFRLKDNSRYYYFTGSFVDTSLFNNGFIKKITLGGDSSVSPLRLDTLSPGKRFDLSANGFNVRLRADTNLPGNIKYLFIKTQKN